MKFEAGSFYHIYNRGINRKKVFFTRRNYEFFLKKVEHYILPHCSIISYCLMPNHFHFLIFADERSGAQVDNHSLLPINGLAEAIRIVLSSYAQAINKQEKRTGNLFQQKTKSKCLSSDHIHPGMLSHSSLYEEDCFNYIHFNPVKSGLVQKPEDWPYSSYREYLCCAEKNVCNKELAGQFLGLKINS